MRTFIQNMRIGMNTTLVLGALAAAYVLEGKKEKKERKKNEELPAGKGKGKAAHVKGAEKSGKACKTQKQEEKATLEALGIELKAAADATAQA